MVHDYHTYPLLAINHMRINNEEAKRRAIHLAEAFIQDTSSYKWVYRCLSASPDLLSIDNKHRKTYIKWTVLFDFRPPGRTFDDGSIIDGQIILRVNIFTEEVERS
jgi:hypothetical protein